MKVYDELVQGSDEWLNLRLGKFGSTDANTVSVNGAGLKTLVYKKIAEITSGQFENNFVNADMERGTRLESEAREIYELTTGNEVKEIGYWELSEYVAGSPDGIVGEKGMIEVKCPRDYKYIKFIADKKIEKKYDFQMQHLMYISDREWCDYIIYSENIGDIIITRVYRDEEKIDKIKIGLEKGTSEIKKILKEIII